MLHALTQLYGDSCNTVTERGVHVASTSKIGAVPINHARLRFVNRSGVNAALRSRHIPVTPQSLKPAH